MDQARSPESTIDKNSVPMRVSRLFADVVKKQRQKVEQVTYQSVKGTDAEITEILAKKIMAKKLV